ncbi:hypothetical protein BDN72DRAFT_906979 [Pluteus cervinus]|uniref:Uncharacterized protein n=1 Tax=Pluteus cervinus TaxID=181527 RepID=A0ACD2ZXY9_9AGAR|nr:hypothetical protein BDN72DRAFT_906979 [Pluteus cervinus]
MAWGATQQFLDLRNQYDNVLRKSLSDFEGLFTTMDVKNNTECESPFKVNWDSNVGEKPKDRDGRVLREILRLDAWILKPGANLAEFTSARFAWTGILDQAWKLKQCLVGWPAHVPVVHINQLSRHDIDHIVTLRRKFEDGKCTDEKEINTVIRIVGWTEEEKALSVLDSANVSLVINTLQEVVHVVADSLAYGVEYEKAVSAKTKTAKKGKARSKSKIAPPPPPRTPSPVASHSPVDDNRSPFPPPMSPSHYIPHVGALSDDDAYANGEDDKGTQVVGDYFNFDDAQVVGDYFNYDDAQDDYNHEQNGSIDLAAHDDSTEPPSSPSHPENPVDGSGSPLQDNGDLDMDDSRIYVRPSVLGGTMAPQNRTPPSPRQRRDPLYPAGTSRQPSPSKKMPYSHATSNNPPSLPIQRLSKLLTEPRRTLHPDPDTRYLPTPISDPTRLPRTYQSRHKASVNASQQLPAPPHHPRDEGHSHQHQAQTPDHMQTPSHSSKTHSKLMQLSTTSVSQAPPNSRSNPSMLPPQLPHHLRPSSEPPRKIIPLLRPHPDRSAFDDARRLKRQKVGVHINVASPPERPSPPSHCPPPLRRPTSSSGRGLPNHHPTPPQSASSLSQHQSIASRRQSTPLQPQPTSSHHQPTSSHRLPAPPQHQPSQSEHPTTASQRQPTPSIPPQRQPASAKRGRDN